MDYELAKQLKEAGYEFQPMSMADDKVSELRKRQISFEEDNEKIRFFLFPTLEELIDECGEKFKQLNFHLMERQAGYGICATADEGKVDMNKVGRWTARARLGKGQKNHIKFWGKTPNEAVAKLWLEFKKGRKIINQ